MADQPRMPKRWNPKLRSSCNGCGAAKLKCDREQPECGRCVSHSMQCVYGFSRKMGKPPRDKLRASLLPASSEHPEQSKYAGSTYMDRPHSGSDSSGSGVVMDMDMDLGCLGSDSGAIDVPCSWDTVGDNTSTNCPVASFNDGIDDLFSFTPVDFTSLDFGEWGHFNDDVLSANLQLGPRSTSTPESSGLKSYLSLGALPSQPTAHQSHTDDAHTSSLSDTASIPPPGINNTGHDCPQEAYEILGSLSFLSLRKGLCIPTEGAGTEGGTGSQVSSNMPLDYVLRLNREASERLGHLLRLLNCSCARSPHLALLYASIISRVLTWYQEAAIDSASCSPIATTLDTASHHPPISGISSYSSKSSGSRGGLCVWPSASSSSYTSSASGASLLPQSAGPAVGPTKMAIGTFNVDDLHVQTALKIQLLLGEMRRAGRLIELFIASHNTGGECLSDKSTHGGIDSLYISLDSWLKVEHSTISNMMRLRLRELST